MKKITKLGLAGAMLTAALFVGGCGVHAGLHIGKSPTPGTAQVHQTDEGRRS